MRKAETVAGNVGYRSQLDRVRRFLERVEGPYALDGAHANDGGSRT